MPKKTVYKVIFYDQGKVYEIYARSVHQGAIFGFIEVEKIIFGEKSSVVVDPSEETLKSEFNNVIRTYIPMHSIIRIDEMNKQGTAKVTEISGKEGNVMPFPVYTRSPDTREK
ncbi:MAG: DUF1820 family protein [Gammaproteobacteria bacterium]